MAIARSQNATTDAQKAKEQSDTQRSTNANQGAQQ
jgi:hypothetical protein